MTTIYRIQDAEGRSPFRTGVEHEWIHDRIDHEYLLHWWVEFGDLRNKFRDGFHYGSGCTDLDTLRRWFVEGEYRKLLVLGYSAVKMSVDNLLAESSIQCVFERAKPLAVDFEVVKVY